MKKKKKKDAHDISSKRHVTKKFLEVSRCSTVTSRDKTRPRIYKPFPESKNTSQNPKILPRIQKHFPVIQTCFGFCKYFGFMDVLLVFGTCFGFLDVFLDSGLVLDSGKCFVPIYDGPTVL